MDDTDRNGKDDTGRNGDARIDETDMLLARGHGTHNTNSRANGFSTQATEDSLHLGEHAPKPLLENPNNGLKKEHLKTHRKSQSDSLNTSLFVRRLTELNLGADYNDTSDFNKEYVVWTLVPPVDTNISRNTCVFDQTGSNKISTQASGVFCEETGTSTAISYDTETLSDSPCRCNVPDLNLLRQNSVQKRALQICRERRRKIKRRRHNSDANLHTEVPVDFKFSDNPTTETEPYVISSPQRSPDYTVTNRPDIIAYLTEETNSGERKVFPCRQNSIQKRSWLRTQKHRQRRRMMRSLTS